MSEIKLDLTVEQFKLVCVMDDKFTDDQVWVLMQGVVLNSEEDVREFAAVLHRYRPNLERRFFPNTPWSKDDILKMWPQAVGELQGLRNHYMRTNAGITASQLSMALQLAGAEFERLRNS